MTHVLPCSIHAEIPEKYTTALVLPRRRRSVRASRFARCAVNTESRKFVFIERQPRSSPNRKSYERELGSIGWRNNRSSRDFGNPPSLPRPRAELPRSSQRSRRNGAIIFPASLQRTSPPRTGFPVRFAAEHLPLIVTAKIASVSGLCSFGTSSGSNRIQRRLGLNIWLSLRFLNQT